MSNTISRRAWLARAAAGGAGLAFGMAWLRAALAQGAVAQGVSRVSGDVRINARPAQPGMEVKPGDIVVTGSGAALVAVVGRDAYMLRGDTVIEITPAKTLAVVGALRVVTGAILAVFQTGQAKQVRTNTATIGIRGTAVYVELDSERTYVCTCYGTAQLTPVDDPQAEQTVVTRYHDQPRYIYPKGIAARSIEPAPVVNHTDAELVMLESLVGRTVPFSGPPRY